MAQKQCSGCLKVKEIIHFSKCKANKDGLQNKCKECNKKDNLKFRTEINPQHHKIWQVGHLSELSEYVKKYRKADKTPIIYAITNPEGKQYIGQSMMNFSVRILEHRSHYRRATKGKRERLDLLHDSFDKYGMDNHDFKIMKELPNFTRKQLREVEKAYITLNKLENISLNK
jgi:hypothetical protein